MSKFPDGGGTPPIPLSRENPLHERGGGIKPLLFSSIPNIFAVNILLKTGNIQSLIALFLSHIKIKILKNSWHFLMVFSDVLSL